MAPLKIGGSGILAGLWPSQALEQVSSTAMPRRGELEEPAGRASTRGSFAERWTQDQFEVQEPPSAGPTDNAFEQIVRTGVELLSPHVAMTADESIRRLCNDLMHRVPQAQVIQYIDQAHNRALQAPELLSDFGRAIGGVCGYMVSKWLELNQELGQDVATEAFGNLLEYGFEQLVHGQQRRGADIEEFRSKGEGLVLVRAQLERQLQTAPAEEHPTYKQLFGDLELQEKEWLDKQNQLYAAEGGGEAHLSVVQGTLSELKRNLLLQTAEAGYYRLSLLAAGSDTPGHVLGLHMTDTQCRLMDPNTAEWQTPNRASLCDLVLHHIDELYSDLSRYQLFFYPEFDTLP